MMDLDDAGAGSRDRLPQLARHPQSRGRRRRALPGEDGGRAGRARLRGHRSSARRTRPRRRTRTVDGVRFVRRGSKLSVYRRGHARAAPRRPRATSTSSSTSRTGCRSSPAWSPAAGGRAGAPRAPRAVAGRLPRPGRPGRLVDRAPARAAALPARASTSRSRAPPAPSCAALGVRGAARRRRAQRHRPGRCRSRPGKAPTPMIAVVGRLVPHKQVEHAIDAALALRERVPGPAPARRRQRLVGGPSCTRTPRATVPATPSCSRATSTRTRKHEIYEQAWVLALPSLKEGWGLVVGEAGMHAHADRGLPLGRRHPGVDRRRTLGRARRRPGRVHARRSATCSPTSVAAATRARVPASRATRSPGSTPRSRSPSWCERCWPVERVDSQDPDEAQDVADG